MNQKMTTAIEANQLNLKNMVGQLNDLYDEFNALKKIISFLGDAALVAQLQQSAESVEGATYCFRMAGEQFITSLANLDHLIKEVKSYETFTQNH
jgi:hypothetical protein